MNKTTEALKLAGKALGCSQQHLDLYHPEWVITRQQNDKALAAIREALAEQELYEPEGRCKECLAYNGHLDYCSKSAPVKRPPNCGTGYCSCIECIYGKDGCVADEEQCNDGCLARESVIANALKLADEIDAEFFQGRISNHSGRQAAQMLRMLVDAPVQPVKQDKYKKAYEIWQDKTEWVQETAQPRELGLHRADVLKMRIEAAVLAEREACAKVCEEVNTANKGFPLNAKTYAAAIRARSDK